MFHRAQPVTHSVAVIATALLTVPAAAVPPEPPAGRAAASAPRGPRAEATPSGLYGLAELVVERLLLADAVAAAKFGTGTPITDPARERDLLKAVATLSAQTGLAPAAGVRFFRAQIEAAKAVQRGLHERWRAHPHLRPARRPDLATEIRPRLDQLTPRMLLLLEQTEPVRAEPRRCQPILQSARLAAESRAHLDGLHRQALRTALAPVCTPSALPGRREPSPPRP